jgi:hypothetical protein
MLFNILEDMLEIFIPKAKADGQVGGLIPHLVQGGFLFYSWNMTLRRK